MKTYKALDPILRKQEGKQSFIYNEKCQGYIVTDNDKLLQINLGTEEDLVRYQANERKHIFPEYDPKLYRIGYDYQMLDLDVGVPFKIWEKNKNNLELPNGLYIINYDHEIGPYLRELNIYTDTYIDYRENVNEEIYNDLLGFKNNRNRYVEERGRHRSSILLYGPPGNGKTREICRILECSKENELVSIFVPGSFQYLDRVDLLKKPLEGRNVVFVLEELTERTKDGSSIEELLSFLDGELSWNNCFTIATTNYPDNLPSNIVDRPGRFTKVIEFGNPKLTEIETFLLKKNYNTDDAKKYSAMLKNLSLDYICFIITESKIKNKDIEVILKETKQLRDKISTAFRKPMGIMDD